MSQPSPAVMPGEQPPKKKGGCMGCSWGCILPVGCVLLLVVGCGGGFGWFLGWPYYSLLNSESYAKSVQKAKDSPAVKAVLGDPVKESYPSSFSYSKELGQPTNFSYKVSLTGPKGEGVLNVIGSESGGQVTYSTFQVISGDKTIDLLNEPAEKGPN